MIGTCWEILLFATYDSRFANILNMSRQRLVGLRKHINEKNISKKKIDLYLIDLSAVCIRPSFTLPAIVRDKHGKFFNELTMIRMVASEEKMRDLNLGKVCASIKQGQFPNKETVREVLRRKGWTMFAEREVVPSIWELPTI